MTKESSTPATSVGKSCTTDSPAPGATTDAFQSDIYTSSTFCPLPAVKPTYAEPEPPRIVVRLVSSCSRHSDPQHLKAHDAVLMLERERGKERNIDREVRYKEINNERKRGRGKRRERKT